MCVFVSRLPRLALLMVFLKSFERRIETADSLKCMKIIWSPVLFFFPFHVQSFLLWQKWIMYNDSVTKRKMSYDTKNSKMISLEPEGSGLILNWNLLQEVWGSCSFRKTWFTMKQVENVVWSGSVDVDVFNCSSVLKWYFHSGRTRWFLSTNRKDFSQRQHRFNHVNSRSRSDMFPVFQTQNVFCSAEGSFAFTHPSCE